MQKYEIKGIVGEGAYGIVYQAKVKETGEIGKNTHYFALQFWLYACFKQDSLFYELHQLPYLLKRLPLWSSNPMFQTVTRKFVHNR